MIEEENEKAREAYSKMQTRCKQAETRRNEMETELADSKAQLKKAELGLIRSEDNLRQRIRTEAKLSSEGAQLLSVLDKSV